MRLTREAAEGFTHLMVDNNVGIPADWAGVSTYLVSSLNKDNAFQHEELIQSTYG